MKLARDSASNFRSQGKARCREARSFIQGGRDRIQGNSLDESHVGNLRAKNEYPTPSSSESLSRTCYEGPLIRTFEEDPPRSHYGRLSIRGSEDRFPQFPKLPIEMRVKIWRNALPGPRFLGMFAEYLAKMIDYYVLPEVNHYDYDISSLLHTN